MDKRGKSRCWRRDGSRGSLHQRKVEREEREAGSQDGAEVGINV